MTDLHPHPVPLRAGRLYRRRQLLLVSCAFGAASLLLGRAEPASAQAFDGFITGVSGSVSRNNTSGTTETIQIGTTPNGSATAIINWSPSSNSPSPYNFLPQGSVATFEGPAGFAVLNRINAASGATPVIQFNGTVLSQLQGSGARGGTIIFSTPTGIILGPTAAFDVGNLVLTTLNVGTVGENGYGPYFDPAGLTLSNAQSPYNQAIVTEPGSRIRAENEGSFVVLAAPRVIHGGNTYVNGSSVYFGGEGISYTVNNGLFDIVIDAGSDGNVNPIVHTGTTTGPASTGPNDPHAIYMVAAPFSSGDAITMLVGGSVGFEGASVDNGEIVLSAGFDIEAGQIVDNIDRGAISSKYGESNIRITGGTFTSDVTGRATEDAIAVSDDGALSFSGDLNLVAYNNARLGATNGDVSVAGDVSLTSLGPLEFGYGSSALAIGPLAIDISAGEASITATNGQSVTISGNASLDASATGEFENVDDTSAGFGEGGSVRLETASGGTIQIDGNVDMLATGTGASEDGRLPEIGGDGFGGTAAISAGGGQIAIDGGLNVDVSGTGSVSSGINNPVGPVGASGFGGDIVIETSGSGITIAGATTLDASGNGGFLNSADVEGVGGSAQGGSIRISANGGSVSFGTATEASASATGEDGPNGGEGRGGTLAIEAIGNGTVDLGSAFEVFADAQGGTGTLGDGGLGQAGTVTIAPSAGPARITGGAFTVSADGQGGDGAGNGGDGRGGSVRLAAQSDSGVIELGNVVVTAIGEAGAGGTSGGPGDGGAGTGGTIFAGTEFGYGSTGVASSATFGNLDLRADGLGGAGSRNGGAGNGGSARIEAQAGQVSFGGASNLSAQGTGGAAGALAGGTGQGGNVGIRAATGRTVLASAGNTVLDASGVGGRGGTSLGTGGLGRGGTASIDTVGGTMTLSGSFALGADGTGGVSSPDVPPVGIGGNGQGGQAYVQAISNGQITLGATGLSATGTGGAGIRGGDGTGGRNEISGISGGRVTAGNVTAAADGIGGDGRDTQNGGLGTGGLVRLLAEADGGALALGNVTATARGTGGAGGTTGGIGDGGDLFAGTELGYGGTGSAATATFGNISLDATGTGGAGGTAGGDGLGGTAQVRAPVGQVSFGGTSNLVARGLGGAGTGSGTAGGDGNGGTAGVLASAGTTIQVTGLGTTLIDSGGVGGNGTGQGGAGTGGTAYFTADGGEIAMAGNVAVRSDGAGGNGSGVVGGSEGTGGLARIGALGGGEVSFTQATVTSDGRGGIGVIGGVGRAGNSPDPTSQVLTGAFIAAENGTITGASAIVSAQGFGGDSIGAGDPLAGGSDGGDGFGGTAQIVALNADGPSSVDIGSANLDISAQGGDGATSYSGGDATAGTTGAVLAETLGNSIAIDNLVFNANARGGNSGDAVDSLIGNGGNATAGFITIGTASGPGTGPTAGSATFGTVQANALAVGGNGIANGSNGGNGAGGAIVLLARGGTLAAGSVTFTANGTGGAGATGGTGTGGEAGALLTTRFQTADGAVATIGSFNAASRGVGGTGGTTGLSQHGRVFVDVAGSTANFGQIDLATSGDSTPSDPSLAQPVLIRATDGVLAVSGVLTVNSATSVDFVADEGTISAGTANIFAPETILLSASETGVIEGGAWNLDAANISAFHSGRPAGGSTVDVTSLVAVGQNIDLGEDTVVRASDTLGFNANSVSISGLVVAPDIFISGTFIDITDTGFIGDASTVETTLDIQPYSGGPFAIGGESESGDYALDADELGRIRSRELEISVPSGPLDSERPVDLLVRDLTLSAPNAATGAGAGVNNLLITVSGGEGNALGVVQVEGALRLENAGANDGIAIVAPGRIQIINPEGSIRVLGANGQPSGQLGLQSANIWSASQTIIDQLIANPNFTGRNAALLAASGTAAPRGYIEGGEILLRVGDTLLVQNSGTAEEYAGITVVQNTLTVQPVSQDPIDVYAFGRRINADGSFVVNSPYFREVEFGTGSRYLASAEFNLCAIASGVCPDDAPPEPPPPPEFPIGSEVIEGPVEDTEESVPAPNPDRQEFVDVSFATESLLEEPVTSGGDSGVWDGEDGDCPPGEVCEPSGGGN